MKKIYTLLCLILFLLISQISHAQSFITLDGSQVFSNFSYSDSTGNKDKGYSNNIGGGYSLGYRMYKKGFFGRINLGMRKAGATLTDDNAVYTWNLQYCDLRLGVGYELDQWRLKPYLGASLYMAYLLKANQNQNGLNYDIKENNSLQTTDFGLLVVPGVKFIISDYFSIYSELSYLTGLKNIDKDPNQKLHNKGLLITLGIAATLTKSKPKWLQGR